MLGVDRKQFSQQEIIDKVQDTQIDESIGTFGDIVVKRYNHWDATPDEQGLVVAVSVVGFNDGHPLFVGCMKRDIDQDEAIQHAMDDVAQRCRMFTMRKMMRDILGDVGDDD